MKNFVCYLLVLFVNVNCFSQNSPDMVPDPQPELAIGVGYGRGFDVLKWNKTSLVFPGPPMIEIYSSPVLTLDYQQPVIRNFCLGVAISHQAIRVGSELEPGSFYDSGDRYDRVNLALRPLWNFKWDKRFSFYAGIRLGYTFWHFTSVLTPREYYKDRAMPSSVAGGLFSGVRMNFGRFGTGLELAFGTAPYIVQAHIFYRFGRYK